MRLVPMVASVVARDRRRKSSWRRSLTVRRLRISKRNGQGEKGATVMELIEAAALDDVVIQEFASGLRGRTLRAGDPDYDVARRHYNALINKHPALIVQCAGVADVIDAVNFARTHRVLVAVRGGGHNVAGRALVDDGMVIDLSPMKGIRVDPVRRTIQAQAGVTWGEFDRETCVFGLATTGGLVSTTGIAGFTLGGGLGWLMRKYGLACDNLLSVDLVTADGH